MSKNTLEWQIFAHARPGTVDTSAVPNDQVSNPGTMNPLINLSQRPTFPEEVTKWRATQNCPAGAADDTCWCEPGRTNKCWAKNTKTEQVYHPQGGEDSIGALSDSACLFQHRLVPEQCWVNHITDLRRDRHSAASARRRSTSACRRDCRTAPSRIASRPRELPVQRAPRSLYVARGLDRQALIAQPIARTARRSSAAAKCSGRRARGATGVSRTRKPLDGLPPPCRRPDRASIPE